MLTAIYHMVWIVLVLAGIDAIRMKITWGKVKNINHWVGYGLCALAITILWWKFFAFAINWEAVAMVFVCIFIRGMFFDISLNVLVNFFVDARAIDYISVKSNALNESRLNKIPFWWRRAGYTVLFAITIFIKYKFL